MEKLPIEIQEQIWRCYYTSNIPNHLEEGITILKFNREIKERKHVIDPDVNSKSIHVQNCGNPRWTRYFLSLERGPPDYDLDVFDKSKVVDDRAIKDSPITDEYMQQRLLEREMLTFDTITPQVPYESILPLQKLTDKRMTVEEFDKKLQKYVLQNK